MESFACTESLRRMVGLVLGVAVECCLGVCGVLVVREVFKIRRMAEPLDVAVEGCLGVRGVRGGWFTAFALFSRQPNAFDKS